MVAPRQKNIYAETTKEPIGDAHLSERLRLRLLHLPETKSPASLFHSSAMAGRFVKVKQVEKRHANA